MSRRLSLSLVLACASAFGPPVSAQDASSGEVLAVVAAIVRAQGLACTAPSAVTRQDDASKPDEPVYVISCKEAAYRVRIVPDQASIITRQ